MKETRHELGGKFVYGDDLLAIQDYFLNVFQGFFGQWGNFVLSGCTVNGTEISPGIIMLDGKLCTFSGSTGISTPYYVAKSNTIIQRVYDDGIQRPVYEIYEAIPVIGSAQGAWRLDNAGRFQNAIQTTLLRMVTDAQISTWNSKANGTHSHNAGEVSETASRLWSTPSKEATWNAKANQGGTLPAHYDTVLKIATGLDAKLGRGEYTMLANETYTVADTVGYVSASMAYSTCTIRLPNLDAAKAGKLVVIDATTNPGSVTVTNVAGSTLANLGDSIGNLYRTVWYGTFNGSTTTWRNITDNIAATAITGVLATDNIPSLDASKLTSGIFAAARIPNLDASKVTSGKFDGNRVVNFLTSPGDVGSYDVRLSDTFSGGNFVDLSLSPFIPAGAKMAYIKVFWALDAVSGVTFRLNGYTGNKCVMYLPTNFYETGGIHQVWVPLDSNRIVEIEVNIMSGRYVDITVLGYI